MAGGGDRHANGHCVPQAGLRPGTARYIKKIKQLKARRKRHEGALAPARGVAVVGTKKRRKGQPKK
ncbi:MAG: hypothetical protein COU85_01040 [Candidatus Portnoybacteria bacterium CG10_big_fil_rev_8_21_14_0_10_44_7]|uniref:Uncharacterized protein n=1 Tax=Candidatus Portnoybacteria bacterium CG10_big_fil_rev_8_21_14_0_10_44_7 TaxID=1974816 RepID=A0A2M8KJ44_9BACT|nr:MAG: hypothetical protein COU85_01040 [Candidatus Portnoybacteria bacterium CG10_big_fil_rev_8_21_14_0_10_44_7]